MFIVSRFIRSYCNLSVITGSLLNIYYTFGLILPFKLIFGYPAAPNVLDMIQSKFKPKSHLSLGWLCMVDSMSLLMKRVNCRWYEISVRSCNEWDVVFSHSKQENEWVRGKRLHNFSITKNLYLNFVLWVQSDGFVGFFDWLVSLRGRGCNSRSINRCWWASPPLDIF